MLCETCVHKYVCRKSEGYAEAYNQNGLILNCNDFKEEDEEKRIRKIAKELIENILNKEF